MFEHRYNVTQRKIGEGGQGSVYVAFDILTGQQMACKIINLDHHLGKVRSNITSLEAELLQPSNSASVEYSEKVKILELYKTRFEDKMNECNREHKVLQGLNHVRISLAYLFFHC